MGAQPIRVLLVSEDRGLLRCLSKLLKICGCEVCQVGVFRQAAAALESTFRPISSSSMPKGIGMPPWKSAAASRRGEHGARSIRCSWRARRECMSIYTGPGCRRRRFPRQPGRLLRAPCTAPRRVRELELERRLVQRTLGVDPLTGLPNRRALESRLDGNCRPARGKSPRGVCVLMEIDFFHRVDHQFGRHAGETVLRMVAARSCGN